MKTSDPVALIEETEKTIEKAEQAMNDSMEQDGQNDNPILQRMKYLHSLKDLQKSNSRNSGNMF